MGAGVALQAHLILNTTDKGSAIVFLGCQQEVNGMRFNLGELPHRFNIFSYRRQYKFAG